MNDHQIELLPYTTFLLCYLTKDDIKKYRTLDESGIGVERVLQEGTCSVDTSPINEAPNVLVLYPFSGSIMEDAVSINYAPKCSYSFFFAAAQTAEQFCIDGLSDPLFYQKILKVFAYQREELRETAVAVETCFDQKWFDEILNPPVPAA